VGKQAFDRKLEEIAALRSAPEEIARERLGKALKDRSGFAVGKAAQVISARRFHDLIPGLVEAFERCLNTPAKTDPQCWAKTAIAKALRDLGHSDSSVFLRGLKHIQHEPGWGGHVDTAGGLRSTCALALVACDLDSFNTLLHLTDLLADAEVQVRIDAARAIAQLSAREGALPLRLKALTAQGEPEVVGQCLTSLLSLSPEEYVPFVAGFLAHEDPDLRMEAAAALAASQEPAALVYLKNFWSLQTDPEVKRALLMFLGGSPLPDAAEFLLAVLEEESGQIAADALKAMSKSRYHEQVRDRAASAVAAKDEPDLARLLAETFLRPVDRL
jgi:HEAT repeat protein